MENNKNTTSYTPQKEDKVGIRATLNNMGISNDKIGYDESTNTVTLDGKAFMKPSYLDEENGVSYANKSEIEKNLTSFYKDSKNPIVKVSDAYSKKAGRYGLSADALSYSNDTVTIGGKAVNTLFTDKDGKAWAWQSDVDKLLNSYVADTGVKAPSSVAEKYENEYMTDIWQKVNDLYGREFSYDLETDPVYLAYKEKYTQDANRASKDAMANYSALTGGYTNSAAATAGAMANQYYMSLLSNAVPELFDMAYERFQSKNQADFDVINTMLGAYDTAYKNASDANDKMIKNANYSAQSNTERDDLERERYWNERINALDADGKELENYWDNILNSQKSILNNLDEQEQKIYLEYYKRLIEADLEKTKADTAKVWQSI